MSLKIPDGWRLLDNGERILPTDRWLDPDGAGYGRKGSENIAHWTDRFFRENETYEEDYTVPHIRRIPPEGKEVLLPANFVLREVGEILRAGDRYCLESEGSHYIDEWRSIRTPGSKLQDNTLVAYPVNSLGDELGNVLFPDLVPDVTDIPGTWVRVPLGYSGRSGDLINWQDESNDQIWESFEEDDDPALNFINSDTAPIIREEHLYIQTRHSDRLPAPDIKKTSDCPPTPGTKKNDAGSNVEPPTKEEVKMAGPAPIANGFFAQMKASVVNAGKTAASTTLAEKITELVIARLPKKVQSLCKIAPAPLRVFLISTAVFAAATRFDIPGRDRVRDISKYAVDGSMHEAFRLVSRLLEPVFRAIRDMAPDDLKSIMDEAKDSTDTSTTVG